MTVVDRASGDLYHRWPHLLPGDRALLYAIGSVDAQAERRSRVAMLDLASGTSTTLLPEGTTPRFVPSGHIAYSVGGDLMIAPFDPETLRVTGPSRATGLHPRVLSGIDGGGDFEVATDGTLALVPSRLESQRTLVWVDLDGRQTPIGLPAGEYRQVALSPDGTRAVLTLGGVTSDEDLVVAELDKLVTRRLTSDAATDRHALWTPDGRSLVFNSDRGTGSLNLFTLPATGAAQPTRLTTATTAQSPYTWAADGRRLLFMQINRGAWSIGTLEMDRPEQVEWLLDEPFVESKPAISPGGRWLAYESNETGQFDVYVRPYPNVHDEVWRVTTNGCTDPVWSRDGTALFCRQRNAVAMVPVTAESTFVPGAPRTLFRGDYLSETVGQTYDVAPDGQRFLMIKTAPGTEAGAGPDTILVVKNWAAELRAADR